MTFDEWFLRLWELALYDDASPGPQYRWKAFYDDGMSPNEAWRLYG